MLPTSLAAVVRVAPMLLPLVLCVLALTPDLTAQPNRGNPEDEFVLELPVFGRMIGTITTIKSPGWGEEYGRERDGRAGFSPSAHGRVTHLAPGRS